MDILDQFQYKAVPKELPASNVLYHYTDSKGLFGIISSTCLWATQLQFLNDRKEFKQAVEILVNILVQRADPGIGEDKHIFFESMIGHSKKMDGARTFVVSLSEEPDLLSQWRGYGGKGGYSIGFDCNRLLTLAHKRSFRLIKCIYDESLQHDLLNGLIQLFFDRFVELSEVTPQMTRDLISEFYRNFLLIGSSMKHPSFKEEKEWRLVGGPFPLEHALIKYRPTESMLIPHYEFPLAKDDKLAIDNIWIGPHNDMSLAIESTNSFLATKKKSWVTNYSSCPFRI